MVLSLPSKSKYILLGILLLSVCSFLFLYATVTAIDAYDTTYINKVVSKNIVNVNGTYQSFSFDDKYEGHLYWYINGSSLVYNYTDKYYQPNRFGVLHFEGNIHTLALNICIRMFDFDNDGYMDYVGENYHGTQFFLPTNGTLTVYYNNEYFVGGSLDNFPFEFTMKYVIPVEVTYKNITFLGTMNVSMSYQFEYSQYSSVYILKTRQFDIDTVLRNGSNYIKVSETEILLQGKTRYYFPPKAEPDTGEYVILLILILSLFFLIFVMVLVGGDKNSHKKAQQSENLRENQNFSSWKFEKSWL